MGVLRLFLATVVAMSHSQSIDIQARGLSFWGGYYLGFNGGFAVMAFYMISGFLISTALASKYKDSVATFYFKRAVRIYSLYLPIAAIAFISFGALHDFRAADPAQKFTSIVLIGSDWLMVWDDPFKPGGTLALLDSLHQAWTLSAELTFYCVAPWLLRSNAASAIVLLASVVTRFSLQHVIGEHPLEVWARWLYFFLPSTFVFFLLGHWARLVAQHILLLRKPIIALLLLLTCFGTFITWHPNWDTTGFVLGMTCFALSLPGVFKATKDNAILNWIGALSYPMYLTHDMVRTVTIENWHVDSYMPRWLEPATQIMLPYLLCLFFAAVIAHHFIENPCAWLLTTCRRLACRTAQAFAPYFAASRS